MDIASDIREEELEGHPILTRADLFDFNVKSRNVPWDKLITPLARRGSPRKLGDKHNDLSHYGETGSNEHSKILVCHDMMGNYRCDRFYSIGKKWDDYRFIHWSGIDYFCYFSHNYISIPPPGWINAGHLNGVSMLGTFLTEGPEGCKLMEEFLESEKTAYEMASELAKLCKHFCFEGWLINIECTTPKEKIPYLRHFLEILTKKVHEDNPLGFVIWYDSILEDGVLNWQNRVGDNNFIWMKSCDGFYTNYCWKTIDVHNTISHVEDNGEKLSKVFFGIDVFGRGQKGKMETSETMRSILDYKTSYAIFAPGWTYESLGEDFKLNVDNIEPNDDINEKFLKRNEEFWSLLLRYLLIHSIDKVPFYTEFCVGSGKFTFELGEKKDVSFFNLSQQSLLPTVPIQNYCEYNFEDGVNKGSCLKIIKPNEPIRLFTTNFWIEKTVIFGYASKLSNKNDEIKIILKVYDEIKTKTCEIICGSNYGNSKPGKFFLTPISKDGFEHIKIILELDEMKLPYNLKNNWDVRYFVVAFDSPVFIEDIGVYFKRQNEEGEGLLGAIYLEPTKNLFENCEEIKCYQYLV